MNIIPLYTLGSYFKTGDKPCIALNMEEVLHQSPNDEAVIHRHGYYQIIILEKGTAINNIEFDAYKMEENSISVLFPKQVHNIKFSDDARGYIIMFNDELFCSAVLKEELNAYNISLQQCLNYINPPVEDFKSVYSIFLQIKELYDKITIAKKEQIKLFIKILLLKLMELSTDRAPSIAETREANIYLQFMNLVEDKFRTSRIVKDYALHLDVTTVKLNQICRQYSGNTAIAAIHERTVLEIKRMLVFFGYSKKEISIDLNFDSQSALNKFIAAKLKCTPSKLKSKLLQIYK